MTAQIIRTLIQQSGPDNPVYITQSGDVLSNDNKEVRFVLWKASEHPKNPCVSVKDRMPTQDDDGRLTGGMHGPLSNALGFMAARILWGSD